MNSRDNICPSCGSTKISKGKLMKHASLINIDKRDSSIFSSEFASPLTANVCVNCGRVISIYVDNLEIFK